jgi:hypothetical protein
VRNAETAEFPSTKYPRVDPRHSYVWIRLDGRWRKAHIHKWVRDVQRDRWLCWTFVDIGKPQSVPDWYIYSPETIRERSDGDQPPNG